MKKEYEVPVLPLEADLETKRVLKKLSTVRAALAELKGIAATIPNANILISTLSVQEAKDSSAVENIITTHDEAFRAQLGIQYVKGTAAKEVQNYVLALKTGFELVKSQGIITNATILKIQQQLEKNDAGYRKLPGTELKNDKTGEVVYTPPQSHERLVQLMGNLVEYLNVDEPQDIDPVVKMAIIHHQFESIHPFYDGNGRTGRILNILYLVAKGLIDLPVLYLSRYIIQNKNDYYRLLQQVRDTGKWEDWILFILDGVETVSLQSIELIKGIKELMQRYKIHIRKKYKFYSQDLLNNLFNHPYTKIEYLQKELKVSRQSASKYLNQLVDDPLAILKKVKIGRDYFFVNHKLMDLFIKYDYKL